MDNLSSEELDRLSGRFLRTLRRYDAIPLCALLYRVGEVGTKRVEPHLAGRALLELANNLRPRRGQVAQGPWLTRSQLYASADHDRKTAEELGEECLQTVAELASLVDAEA